MISVIFDVKSILHLTDFLIRQNWKIEVVNKSNCSY